jgi:hypothetical protein
MEESLNPMRIPATGWDAYLTGTRHKYCGVAKDQFRVATAI